jgi:hypothetical protein
LIGARGEYLPRENLYEPGLIGARSPKTKPIISPIILLEIKSINLFSL